MVVETKAEIEGSSTGIHYGPLAPTMSQLDDWTLPRALRRSGCRYGDKTFLVAPEEDRSWTYGQILEESESIARNLTNVGSPGDRLIIQAANSSQFVRSWFGTALASMVEVPINVAYEGEFLAHQMRTVDARWAVVDDVFAERFVRVRDDARSLEAIWVIDTGSQASAVKLLKDAGWTAHAWEKLLESREIEFPEPDPTALAAILFTSGTTGPSKGVAMPHAQTYFFASEVVSMTHLTEHDTYLSVTPLFHGNAKYMAALPALIAGARLVIRSKFSASGWIDQVREHNVTVTNFLGVMMDFAWKQPARSDDAVNDLRVVFAAPTAGTFAADFRRRFGIEALVEAYGLTETCSPVLSPYGEERPIGAAGKLVSDWFEVRIVDPDTDRELNVGEIGELLVRSKQPWITSLGYYRMPEKTLEAWRNLWFHTGDAMRVDADGWYYFIDRYKDALRRRGENISSYEIEQVLLSLPDVLECAVVGIPADVDGGEEEVMAVIVAEEQLDACAIWQWCDGRMPAFAIPRYVRFVRTLPKTPTSKVMKVLIKQVGVTSDTYDRTKLSS
jgi:crotonobetaine/carnitine-CoA ligase